MTNNGVLLDGRCHGKAFSAQALLSFMNTPSWFDTNLRAALISAFVGALVSGGIAWWTVSHQVDRDNKQDAEKATDTVVQSQITRAVDPAASKEAHLGDRLKELEKFATRYESEDRRLADIDMRLTRIDDRVSNSDRGIAALSAQFAEQSKAIDRMHRDVTDLIKGTVRGAAAMPLDELNKEAPQILAALRVAAIFKVDIDNDSLRSIRLRLAEVSGSLGPAYWQLASSVVTDESRANANIEGPAISGALMADVSGNRFENIHIIIDGARFSNNVFIDSVIEYRGGPTRMTNTVFINCRFVLNVQSAPPSDGARFSKQLLASATLRKVQLN